MSKTYQCQICNKTKNKNEVIPAAVIRPALSKLIKQVHPNFNDSGYICLDDLNIFRNKYIQQLLEDEKGELTELEETVIQSLKDHEVLSRNVEVEYEEKLKFGERLADKVAAYGGSWKFIISFAIILAIWIIINSAVLLFKSFDPYPFILLNLVLSCLAAIQAPIIMMSQNRQEAKDRIRSQHDYQINLKAEVEIRNLHQKIDHLLTHQWERLVQIQQVQLEMMEELKSRK
ncbi:MAG: DUF1003 domain-containing protein [Ignavibacteriota bacterium]|jgi:uncharacterized membrane protein|nr:MAG: DUF1003 domain-containing protein [Chlorobiota bacterium]MBE7476480.1 DUF1003 domain-containing protein [Ignavibacteriales bacterium]MBL1123615.1 DUF1003 domain-containing protein [Ignavibacteriota bacterium]MBV6420776.1 hypothetical protein [Ignavibacteriaceae bacterium]MCE7855528.1 DUF1003 domain-containing protein [Ignavibacteria bacterium CHB3]MEB2297041.1 DUF1003 domain-containing protein [Ignavibacteria bacterium]